MQSANIDPGINPEGLGVSLDQQVEGGLKLTFLQMALGNSLKQESPSAKTFLGS